jgi:predicted AAA+ superfamily ATPase
VARWLEVLDACFLTLRLPPADLDFGRRLIRRPKLHFLASSTFESQAVSELYRNARHAGETPDLRYWRDSNGFEIPLIVQSETSGPMPVGIAESPTPTEMARLRRWMDLAGLQKAAFIAQRPASVRAGGVLRYALGQL